MIGDARVQEPSRDRVRLEPFGNGGGQRRRPPPGSVGCGAAGQSDAEKCGSTTECVDRRSERAYTPAATISGPGARRLPAARPSSGRMKIKKTAVSLIALAFLALPGAIEAQIPGPGAGNGVRIGIAVGGISTTSVSVEFYRNSRSIDLSIGTWSFRDLSISATGRQYFGAGSARPVVGAGLWLVGAPGDEPGERTGWGLVARVPIGVDWNAATRHSAGLFLNVNRGLWVRRSNPTDDLPLNRRLVPLPELYYRFAF